ncbi:MAG: efflux RND transporter permease subunit [Actinomycetota bacterium]
MLRSIVTAFVTRPVMTLVLWLAAFTFGVLAYTTLLPRDGFPSVEIPIAVVSGAYLVDDAELVDADVASPIADAVAAEDGVESVQSFSLSSGFSVIVEFQDDVEPADGVVISQEVVDGLDLPEEAIVSVSPINAAQFLNEYDLLVGVYGPVGASSEELEAAASAILPALNDQSDVELAEVVEQVSVGVNPATGEEVSEVTDFNLFTTDTTDGIEFRPSIAVGVVATEGADSLDIRDATDAGLADAARDDVLPADYEAVVAIDFATQIRQQIGSLQANVLTGVIAVAIVALLLISWRASIVAAVFIFTVLATTVGVLYLIGISLNTISLFGVILALGLFVDDAIVITEAIAAAKQEGLDRVTIIRRAIARVGTASISGTVTTVMVFAAFLSIGGILGDFIRILPISVIVALTVSVVLSFIFIPVAAYFVVLPAENDRGILSGVLDRIADAVADLPARSGAGGWLRAGLAVGLSVVMFIVGVGVFAPRAGFNIFPAQKDSNFLALEIAYAPGTSIDEARDIAIEVNELAADALGDDLLEGYTYEADARGALAQYILTDMGMRETAPDLVEEKLDPIAESYTRARVTFSQVSAGPPELAFPFLAQVYGEDIESLSAAAELMASELEGSTIERPNGTSFQVLETEIDYTDIVARTDGRRLVEVRARFDADDVTTTTAQTEEFLVDAFPADRLVELGLPEDALAFDLGLESDNQESFASLPFAFMIALISMALLLVVQFRSTVLWALVFLAMPFALFGVFGGLLITGNVISFFVMLGLFGLIGIAVNNTILLTDFANQERHAGHPPRAAIRNAVRRRFRPLVATSLTTVAGLLPLALSDPFWEGLAFTIIFGLLSSTFLVLIAFPFYYLAVETLRTKIRTPWRYTPKTLPEGVEPAATVADGEWNPLAAQDAIDAAEAAENGASEADDAGKELVGD